MSDDGHWNRLESLFERAMGVPISDRPRFLDLECGTDSDLRRELESLLSASDDAPDYLQRRREDILGPHAASLLDPVASDDTRGPVVGTTVGRYEVLERLGGGGMGVVFRARDATLGRIVALKFLTPESSGNPEARRRLLSEARAASALDHPNICTVHEIAETESGSLFIAMSCYDGETLKTRLERGPLRPDDAWDVAVQISSALAAAHARGIVHRDIKPANVFITRDGVAKLLDFGIARTEGTGSNEPEMVAGTAAYMSPEQALGRETNASTDVWALGAVLFEMLTGERPFRGETTAAVCRAVLDTDPDWDRLPDGHPPCRVVIQRALDKNPARRFVSGRELHEALGALTEPRGSAAADESTPVANKLRRRTVARRIASVFAVILIMVGVIRWSRPSERAGTGSVAVPRQVSFTGNVLEARLSPDGRLAALVLQEGDSQSLNVVALEEAVSTPLFREAGFVCCPVWSPDAAYLAFRTLSGTKLLPRDGRAVPRDVDARSVAGWSPDGTQLYSWWPQAREITMTNVSTGDSSSFALDLDHDWVNGVHWSPLSNRLAIALLHGTGHGSIWTMDADGSNARRVLRDSVQVFSPHWAPREPALYYLRALETPELWKLSLNSDGSAGGTPQRVSAGLSFLNRNRSLVSYSIAASGTRLFYPRRTPRSNLWRFPLDESGGGGRPLTAGTAHRIAPRVAPDGSTIAFVQAVGGAYNLQLLSTDNAPAVSLPATRARRWSPAWAPTGDRLAVGTSLAEEHVVAVVDRSGERWRALSGTRFYPDNHLAWVGTDAIAYVQSDDRNVRVVRAGDGSEDALLADTVPGWFYELRPSPDSRELAVWWVRRRIETLAIISLTDGAIEVLARDMVPIGWSPDGMFVYAMAAQNRVEGGSRRVFRVPRVGGIPAEVLEFPGTVEPWNVDISPDGSWLVAALDQSTSDAWLVDSFDPTSR